MIRFIVVLLLILMWCPVFAFEMQGTLVNNSDGTYSVTLSNQNDERHFYGNAYKQVDGTLTMTVNGQKDETYIGTAVPDHEGYFSIHLINNISHNVITGKLEVQE